MISDQDQSYHNIQITKYRHTVPKQYSVLSTLSLAMLPFALGENIKGRTTPGKATANPTCKEYVGYSSRKMPTDEA
jgi:hypothetical protein